MGEEKKKIKKRKKRQISEEPEAAGRRLLISDNLVEIRLTRIIRRAKDILTPPQLQMAQQSGHLDFVFVNDLGCGIEKGSMGLGRLYKGKYIPPERMDGLIPHDNDDENIGDEEEQVTLDDNVIDVTELKNNVDVDDIDLD